jgi:predicted permease
MPWPRRSKRERDLERELRSDLELEAEEQRANGLSPDEARFAARRALGNLPLIQEATRETWGLQWLDGSMQDLRYGIRSWRNSPGVATVVILTAALGIGANTSIFSIIDAVLLRPLPFPDAGRLVTPLPVRRELPNASSRMVDFGVHDFRYGAWRDQAAIFDGVAAYTSRQFTITGAGEPEQLKIQLVTPGFLRTLRVTPLMGRDFTGADATPRGGQVALLTYQFWTRTFHADPAILTRTITLDGKPYSIAGVLPRGFEIPESPTTSLLIAFSEPAAQPKGAVYFYNVIARLKPHVTIERAEADLALIDQRLEAAYLQRLGRAGDRVQTRVISLHEKLVGNVRPALLVLGGAVALVLLIVCVNICNLLLARAIARQKEIAVRLALGASRGRLLRQLLTEGIVLAFAGGAAGLSVAIGGIALLRAIAPKGVPHLAGAHISGIVLAFNAVVAIATGILFGVAPMRGASGIDPDAVLKATVRSASGTRRHRRLENLLIIWETAFALILLAGAGLLIRTFAGLTAIAPGFSPENVVTARISLPYWKYRTDDRRRALFDRLAEKIQAGPGVVSSGVVACLPYGGFVLAGNVEIEGTPPPRPDSQAETVAVNYASGDYFNTMRIPLLEGRAIDSSDRAGKPDVAVVNQALARRYFPDGRALGSRIRVSGVTRWLEIVGVYGDIKQGGLASAPRPELFQSAAQAESGSSASTVAVHSTADPRIVIPWLRARITELDADLPPPEIETMRGTMAALMASQVFVMRLLALFAGIAITLAAIGIYSVLVCSVERRTREIAIRVALGAKRAHLMGLVLGRGLRLALCGAAIGLAGALVLTRYLETLLYGVTPHDAVTLAAGCGLLVLVALTAAWFPARRATRQDALAALRTE